MRQCYCVHISLKEPKEAEWTARSKPTNRRQMIGIQLLWVLAPWRWFASMTANGVHNAHLYYRFMAHAVFPSVDLLASFSKEFQSMPESHLESQRPKSKNPDLCHVFGLASFAPGFWSWTRHSLSKSNRNSIPCRTHVLPTASVFVSFVWRSPVKIGVSLKCSPKIHGFMVSLYISNNDHFWPVISPFTERHCWIVTILGV